MCGVSHYTWWSMKLCPWKSTLIHSVSPYTTGSDTCETFSAPLAIVHRVTYLNLLHKPLCAPITKLAADSEVVEVVRSLVLYGHGSQGGDRLWRDTPLSLSLQLIL